MSRFNKRQQHEAEAIKAAQAEFDDMSLWGTNNSNSSDEDTHMGNLTEGENEDDDGTQFCHIHESNEDLLETQEEEASQSKSTQNATVVSGSPQTLGSHQD